MPGTASRSGAAYIQPKGPSTSDSMPDAATDFLSPPVRARPVPSAAFATSPAEEVARASSSAGLVAKAALGTGLARTGGDKKSVAASGMLSLVLGPFGWMYAAPLREAVPGMAIYVGLCSLLPHFLLVPLLGV